MLNVYPNPFRGLVAFPRNANDINSTTTMKTMMNNVKTIFSLEKGALTLEFDAMVEYDFGLAGLLIHLIIEITTTTKMMMLVMAPIILSNIL